MEGDRADMKGHTFTVVCEERHGRKVLSLTAPVRYAKVVDEIAIGEQRLMKILPIPKPQGTQSMRYYRGVVVPDIALACGIDDPDEFEQVHQSLAWKFLRISDHPEFGYPRKRSTSKDDLSQDEITKYIDDCIQWAESSIVGCRVRRPNEIDDWDRVHAPDYDANMAA
jgi:hypothetical protein